MKKAKNLYDESAGNDLCLKEAFLASWGWLHTFIKRNCLSLRRRTTIPKKIHSKL